MAIGNVGHRALDLAYVSAVEAAVLAQSLLR
jgi:hypothetical protein